MNAQQELKKLELPSGSTAEFSPFKGKHIKQATAIANGQSEQIVFALIALTTSIDGKKIVMEDLDEMDGRDVLSLMSEFNENF